MVSECVMHLGGIDIVVNDAGNLAYGPLVPLPGYRPENRPDFAEPLSVSLWSGVLDTHLFGAIHVLQEVAPIMLEQRYGRVINVTSVSTSRATPFNSIYDTAKGGLTSLTRSLAAEWARYGVTVNAIAPGEFRTALSASMHDDPNTREKMLRRIPMRRAGELREVGLLAAFLASDAAAYITGQTIGIDGGESV
jgi:NAD(P)-dependent dehydrogenase (short-subunit alcohol dehydrogenase family)